MSLCTPDCHSEVDQLIGNALGYELDPQLQATLEPTLRMMFGAMLAVDGRQAWNASNQIRHVRQLCEIGQYERALEFMQQFGMPKEQADQILSAMKNAKSQGADSI